jgi:putative protein-disulfide isomerase
MEMEVQSAAKQNHERQDPEKNNPHKPDRLILTYYTDPLCCWCWGFESVWQRLLAEHGDQFQIRYIMAGMIRDWRSYQDPYNAVSNAAQMGPVWLQAARLTNTLSNPDIWHVDPPASSYPACIAVKAAAIQSADAEALYLYKVREAVMRRMMNIAKEPTLIKLAEELADNDALNFSVDRFVSDLRGNAARSSFRKDLEQVAIHKIGRYPTLTCTDSTGKGIILVGYRTYDVLLSGLRQMEL